MSLDLLATAVNLGRLKRKSYPGRGIVIGLNQKCDALIQVYWIMGRSESSRNRFFRYDGGRLYVEVADPSKVKDPKELELIVYHAMDEVRLMGHSHFVVSNGAQTDAIVDALTEDDGFYNVLQDLEYEPDAPNYTPRISALCSLGSRPFAEMSILRKAWWDESGLECDRAFHSFDTFPGGIGFCLTTYEDDGNPLPSFTGAPYVLPLRGDGEVIANTFWDPKAVYFPNLVSLAVKEINIESERSTITICNRLRVS